MENKKNYIENLYSEKLGKFEYQTNNADWEALSAKLSKTNFMKFSFATFNVFYLGALLAFAGSSAYLGIANYTLSSKIQLLESKIEILSKNEEFLKRNISIPNTFENQNVTLENNKAINNKKTTKIANNEIVNKNAKTNSPQNKISTSQPSLHTKLANTNEAVNTIPQQASVKGEITNNTIDSLSTTNYEPQKIKRVLKTIFVKQNNVVLKDTVVIKKKLKK